ncbi:MAG: hypothetical protein ACLR3C_06095 [Eggerthella lenta]
MAQPRPSLTLILDLDERLDSEDVRLEIDRCYSYVGSTLVRTHPACDGEPQNIMRFLVKLGTRRYLRAEDEGADELWNDVMERWFYNELYKVSNNMLIYNRRQREVGNPQLVFDWIDVELQNGQLHALLHCDNVSGIRPETSELLTQLRAAYTKARWARTSCAPTCPRPLHTRNRRPPGWRRRPSATRRRRRGWLRQKRRPGCGRGGRSRGRGGVSGAAAFGQRRRRRGGRARS